MVATRSLVCNGFWAGYDHSWSSSSLGLSMEATGGSEIVNRIDQEGDDDGSEIWVFEE